MAFKYEKPILINFGAISTFIKNFQKVFFTDSALLGSITEPYTSAVQHQNGAGNEEKILIYQMSYQNHFCDSPI